MTIYQLPYFGEVSLLEQDYYEIEADINQADTQIILDIANINPTKEEVSEIQLFLKSLPCLDTKIREAFLNEYISAKVTGDGFYGFRPYPFIFSKHAKNF